MQKGTNQKMLGAMIKKKSMKVLLVCLAIMLAMRTAVEWEFTTIPSD